MFDLPGFIGARLEAARSEEHTSVLNSPTRRSSDRGAAMERLGSKRRNIVAGLGPTISQKAYEVGPDFIGRFTREAAGHGRFLKEAERPGHAMFDLPEFIGARLEAA